MCCTCGLEYCIGEETIEEFGTAADRFPLFRKNQISEADIAAEGLDVFAACVALFDGQMQSSYEHYLLKKDLVEHISNTNSS
jgi:hypothetical protein